MEDQDGNTWARKISLGQNQQQRRRSITKQANLHSAVYNRIGRHVPIFYKSQQDYMDSEYLGRENNWIDLFQLITTYSKEITPMETRELIFNNIRNAIHQLHQNGFVHRDIKPENIMVNTETGAIKLIDLGIACIKGLPQTDENNCRNITVYTRGYIDAENLNKKNPLTDNDIEEFMDNYALKVIEWQIYHWQVYL
jgi:serine/threonine protein kinase